MGGQRRVRTREDTKAGVSCTVMSLSFLLTQTSPSHITRHTHTRITTRARTHSRDKIRTKSLQAQVRIKSDFHLSMRNDGMDAATTLAPNQQKRPCFHLHHQTRIAT